MTNKDAKTGPGAPEGGDPLSATGMFLRAFETTPEAQEKPAEPTRLMRPAPPSADAGSNDRRATTPTGPGAAGSGPGEFTQFFQSLDAGAGRGAKPLSQPEAAQAAGATGVIKSPAPGYALPASAAASTSPSSRGSVPESVPEAAPGEFTRIFVSGNSPGAAPTRGDEANRAAPAAPPATPPKARGFSSRGLSDSASGEGSFTQFFKAAPAAPPTRPAQAPPPQAVAAAPAPPSPAPRNQDVRWNSEPVFGSGAPPAAPENPSLSVTGLINSLAAENSGPAPRAQEPAPYRPDPLPFAPAAARPAEPAGMEPGGVTRLIQRLAQEQAGTPVAPPPPPQPAAPVNSGPGEFTRMISGMSAPAGAAVPPAAPPPPAPAAPAFAAPPMPPMPKPAPPPVPAPPKMAPPPPPAAPAFASPAMPKLAPPPPPAPAPPKSKLEAMVPVLLVINTFLLLVILVVLIFLIKAK